MVMRTMEFELPAMATIFLIILCIFYFSKKRVSLIENKTYEVMLIISVISSLIDTIIHVLCAFHSFNQIGSNYYLIINFLNKFVSTGLVIVFSMLCLYTILISKEKIRNNPRYVVMIFIILDLLFFIGTFFCNIELYDAVLSTNANGSLMNFAFFGVGIYLIITLFVTIFNFKKDKRCYAIFMILGVLLLLYVCAYFFKALIIYDIAMALFCYIMFFSIENPDMKMIDELQVARDQAEKANRAKTDFLSSMSHEIRTPLNAIVGFSDCIMDAENLDEAKENAHDIVNASQTLLEIVNGILDISKIEAGKIEIVNSPYNASEVFNELAKLIIPKMNEKGLDFSYNIAPDLPMTLYGDHANLKKVITNLLSNACKYTDRGFVHYEVNCVNSNNVSKLIISVEDSGRGIKKENIDKMFTKFQRLDEDRNTTIEGTGLGLAITKQLVELMGGRIIVHTVYGEGSKFTIVLNQRIENNVIKEEKKVKSTLDLHDVKILLVDDTSLNIKVACKLLEKYNANMIDTCDSGFACIEKIKNGNKYDLILLDDMMPKMSGVITLKRLKEDPNFNIPTIALTANAITGMREKYLADGFNDYLAKPIEKEQLIRVVNQVLGRSATEELDKISTDTKVVSINSEDSGLVTVDTENKDRVIPITDDDINMDEILSSTRPIEVSKEENIESLEDTNNISEIIDISENNTFDRNYLESNGADINHALELLGDMDMYNMTIHDFFDEVDEKWNRIIEYKNTNNMSDYAIEVHSLKSDCKYLGFMGLADIAYEHELKSKENDSDFVNSNFLKLETEYNRVHEVVKNYVNNNPTE